jgi:hypothetical protein
MRTDDFEDRLSRTPRSPLPASWKKDILAAARVAATTGEAVRPGRCAEPSVDPGATRNLWRACLEVLRAPWGVLAAGCVLVFALRALNGWVAIRPADETRAFVAGRSGASVLAAARSHRDRVVVWVDRGGMEVSSEEDIRGGEPREEGQPRGHWQPDGGIRGNRWNTKEREA